MFAQLRIEVQNTSAMTNLCGGILFSSLRAVSNCSPKIAETLPRIIFTVLHLGHERWRAALRRRWPREEQPSNTLPATGSCSFTHQQWSKSGGVFPSYRRTLHN